MSALINQKEASKRTGVIPPQVRRLLKRYQAQGLGGLAWQHGVLNLRALMTAGSFCTRRISYPQARDRLIAKTSCHQPDCGCYLRTVTVADAVLLLALGSVASLEAVD